jgi:hypothetical protein
VLIWRDEHADRRLGTVELTKATHKFDEFARLEKDEAAIAMVVRQRAKRFVAEGDLMAELPIQ